RSPPGTNGPGNGLVPEEDCPCSDTSASLLENAPNAYPQNPSQYSAAPVRFVDGTVKLTFQDLSSSGLGAPWGQTRTWTNDATDYPSSGLNGNAVNDVQNLSVFDATQGNSGAVLLFVNGRDTRYFDWDGARFTERFYGQEHLTHNT